MPLLGVPTAITVSAPPSTSVSFATSDAPGITTGVFANVDAASSTAIGGSLIGVTMTVTSPTSVRSPSLTVYANVAVPKKSAAGVNVTVPLASATVPLVGIPTAITVSGSPSASVSFATSAVPAITAAVSSAVIIMSSTATGGVLAPTVTVTVAVANSPVSVTV